jgi:hypothetical protein
MKNKKPRFGKPMIGLIMEHIDACFGEGFENIKG